MAFTIFTFKRPLETKSVPAQGGCELGDDESLTLFVFAGLAFFTSVSWARATLGPPRLGHPLIPRVTLALWPVGCLAILLVALKSCADPLVRNDDGLLLLFLLGGLACIELTCVILAILGVSLQTDAVGGFGEVLPMQSG